MRLSAQDWIVKIDALIRLFFYILVFWLPYSIAVVESCVITAVVLWIIKRLMMHGLRKSVEVRGLIQAFKPLSTPLDQAIGIFLMACLISVVSSIFWQAALMDFITKILEWFAVFWIIQESFKSKKQLLLLLAILLFSAAATAFDAIMQHGVWGKDIFNHHPLTPDGRATAGFRAPGGLGSFLITMIPITLSMALLSRRKTFKFLFLGMIALLIWALVLTFTRGAWTGAFVGMLVFFFAYSLWLKHIETAKTISLTLLFLLLIAFFPLLLNTQSTLKLIKRTNTVSWRLNIWKDSWQMIKDRPFFGHGVNTYMPIFQSYRRDPLNHPTYAHNCFVQLATEVGMIGMAAFSWIFLTLFVDSHRRLRTIGRGQHDMVVLSIGMLSAIVAFLVHSFFDTSLYAVQLGILLWLLVGLQTKINQLATERT